MPLDFDPVYHTETMVKILRSQGSSQYASELAEIILEKDPNHHAVRQILEELKEDARLAFERFRNAGRSSTGESPEKAAPDDSPNISTCVEPSQQLSEVQSLLNTIHEYRKSHE